MASRETPIQRQCRAVWCKALVAPVAIPFPTAKEAARAKFVFYDAIRNCKRTGEGSADLREAADLVEITLSDDKTTIILRRKSLNPFFAIMERELIKIVGPARVAAQGGSTQDAAPTTQSPAPDPIAESLARLQGALAEGDTKPAPANPYYSREEL